MYLLVLKEIVGDLSLSDKLPTIFLKGVNDQNELPRGALD